MDDNDKGDKNNLFPDYPFNRRWVLIFSGLIIIVGLTSAPILLLGLLTSIIGITLFFTDSWIVYLLIFLVWTFGGLTAGLLSISSTLNIFVVLIIVVVGVFNLIDLARKHKKNVSEHPL